MHVWNHWGTEHGSRRSQGPVGNVLGYAEKIARAAIEVSLLFYDLLLSAKTTFI